MDAVALLHALHGEGALGALSFDATTLSEAETGEMLDGLFQGSDWRDSEHGFVQIGTNGSGGRYLLWSYDGLKGEAPVVLLTAAGDGAMVADSATAFAHLLCAGNAWQVDAWVPQEGADAALAGRAEAALGACSDAPTDVLARALMAHPDFAAWVQEMQDELRATVDIPGRR